MEIFMKKLICLLLAVVSMLCVVSCGEELVYEPGTEFYKSMTVTYYTKKVEAGLHYYDEKGNNIATDVYLYDEEKERVTGDVLATYERKFDANGRVTEVKYKVVASGKETVTNYAYNAAGEVEVMTEKVTEGGKTTTATYLNTFDEKGRIALTTLTMGEDVKTRVYTYVADTQNCEYVDFDGSVYRLTYNDDGNVFVEYAKVSTVSGEKVTVTETTTKYRYEYKTDETYAKYGNEKTVCTFIKAYDEWENHISTTVQMYDRYGNLISIKKIDPSKEVLSREVYVYSPERPTKG